VIALRWTQTDRVALPETRYAKSGDLRIGYQVVGDGPRDVLIDQWFSNVDAQWDFAPLARFLHGLSAFSRVIVFDKRGTGVSDPVALSQMPGLEEWMDDLRAVLDAVGSGQAALLSGVGASLMGILFAATYADRVASLVIANGYPEWDGLPTIRGDVRSTSFTGTSSGLRIDGVTEC
jgi:pimeloyl-ACP methyl ester carboxylesterase